MLKIGKGPQVQAPTFQPRKTQVTLTDLYQLCAQVSRCPEQPAQLVWNSAQGDFTIVAKADAKLGAIWQLIQKTRFESITLWTISTGNVPEVHKKIMLQAG